VDQEFQNIIAANHKTTAMEQNTFQNMMKHRNYPQLIISMLLQFFQQFTGINAIIFYTPVLFQMVGFGSFASLYSSVIVGAVNVLSTLVVVFIVDHKGHRWLLLEAYVQMFVAQVQNSIR